MNAVTLDYRALAALDAASWDRLADRALVGNPFLARQHLLATAAMAPARRGIGAIAIEHAGALVGLFPYRKRRVLPLPWTVADPAPHAYHFSGHPLVDRDCAPAVVGAWLDAVRSGGGPPLWSLGDFDLGSPLHQLIAELGGRHGLATEIVGQYQRPRLTRLPGGLQEHIETVIPRRRLRELERSKRRLAELGTLAFERVSDRPGVARRLEQFLALEHAGWKGRNGTSFLSLPGHAEFARAAYRNAIVDSLLLDGEPIAISINIAAGRTAFTPKCAYDERYRRHAPGLVLEYDVVEAFYREDRFDEMDAATTADGHVVNEFWNGSKQMGRLIIGPADWRTPALARAWAGLQSLREDAKRMTRGWRPSAGAAAPSQAVGWLRGGTRRLLHALRGNLNGLVTGTLIALPGIAIGIKRHEPIAYGIAGL